MEEAMRLFAFVGGVLVGAWAVGRWMRYHRRRLPDTRIDALIADNKALPVRDMETVDWGAVNRAGERRFSEVVRAQRNSRLGLE